MSMRNGSWTVFIALLLLRSAQPAFAQTADDIIEKSLSAVGGRAALAKLTSRSLTGTIRLMTPGGEISGDIEIMSKAPNKSRTFMKLDLSAFGAGQMVFDQRFDGTTGYVLDTLQGNREVTGNQLENMRNSSFPTPFLNYKELGATVELVGKEKVGERDAYVLMLKPKTGSAARQYVDAETYLPVKLVVKIDVPQIGGELEQTTEFVDYRDVDGFKVPFQVRSASSLQTFSVIVTKVEHNAAIDDKLFSKPTN